MVWTVAELIATATSVTTLSPGDVIATGTGGGVGMAKGIKVKHGEMDKIFSHMYAGKSRLLRPGDIVAVKTHMGEAYNVGYLRPIIVRTMVDLLKERGCKPFVTDTTTMPYHPWISRTLALDHLETANRV
jgi:uncharacterized Fe-S center protein